VKAEKLIRGGCVFSEFGSRRRRDYHTHDLVVKGLLAASQALDGPGRLQGTSNVHFAMKYNLTPIGTVAHEVTHAWGCQTDCSGLWVLLL
jgi:nicotinate phosphoribosyltransferase